jgi:hypothetical protein
VRTRQRGKGELSQLSESWGDGRTQLGRRKARTSSVLFRAKFGDGPRTSGAPFSEERAGEFAAAASLAGSGRQHGLGHGGLTYSLLFVKLLRRLIAQIKSFE